MRRVGLLALALVAACTAPPAASPPPPVAPPAAPHTVDLRAVRPDGRGVGQAKVCASPFSGEAECATTDDGGHATISVRPGVYALRAIPPAGARLAEGVVTLDLTNASSAVIALEGRATISGRVKDPGGGAVAGASVCSHDALTAAVECVRTVADGSFTVVVRPGIQRVEVRHPLGTRLMTDWAVGATGSSWTGGQRGEAEAAAYDTRERDVSGVEVTLLEGVELAGTVTAARGGAPVKEAQVCTYPFRAPLGWQCDRTDKDGRYAVLRYPDTYWIWVIPPDESGSRLMYQRYDRVLEGVDAKPFALTRDSKLDFALSEGAVLRGRVTTADGEPVRLALVCADTPFPTGRICRATSAEGNYEIGTRPETYVVQVIPPRGSGLLGGYWPGQVRDWTKAGEVRVTSQGGVADFVLERGVRLTGVVRSARGVPLESTTINVNDASGPRYFASTDLAGRYEIVVRPGSYTVDVFAPVGAEALSLVGQPLEISGDLGYEVTLPDVGAIPATGP